MTRLQKNKIDWLVILYVALLVFSIGIVFIPVHALAVEGVEGETITEPLPEPEPLPDATQAPEMPLETPIPQEGQTVEETPIPAEPGTQESAEPQIIENPEMLEAFTLDEEGQALLFEKMDTMVQLNFYILCTILASVVILMITIFSLRWVR